MNILLTGGDGFVGEYVQEVLDCVLLNNADGRIDLLDTQQVYDQVNQIQPDAVIHLAAQSFVPASFENPRNTFDVNFYGTYNLLEALDKSDFKGRFLYVSSSDVYGLVPREAQPISEMQAAMPRSPYAVSKIAAEALCYQWSVNSQFECVTARPFNHIGPGQSEMFVVSDFAKQLVEIKLGLREPEIKVGDIDVYRDFTDVRDVVRAYSRLLDSGQNSEIYNICSGKGRKIRDLVEIMIDQLGLKVDIDVDQARLRKSEQRYVAGDYTKLATATNWYPEIDISDSIADIIKYWELTLDE